MLLCALTLGGNVTWAWVTLQSGQNALLMSQADEVAKTWRNLILDYGSLAGRFAHGNDAPADPTSRIRWRDVYGVVSIHTTPGESPVRSAQPSFAVSTGKPSPIIFFRGLGTERISPSTGLPAVHFFFDVQSENRGTTRVAVDVELKYLLARDSSLTPKDFKLSFETCVTTSGELKEAHTVPSLGKQKIDQNTTFRRDWKDKNAENFTSLPLMKRQYLIYGRLIVLTACH